MISLFTRPLFCGLTLGLLSAACGDDSRLPEGGGGQAPAGGAAAGGSGAAGGAGGAGAGGLAIDWVPCPRSSDDLVGDDAFCATIPVPLDWDDPEGGTIDFFVKKLPAAMQPPRGQLWLLNGGPGYSGADFEPGVMAQTVDIYLPDHRGTGRSSRLGCAEAETDESDGGFWVTDDELPGCVDTLKAEWGDDLSGFTTTQAARDIGEVIEAVRQPGDDILVTGGSYGSIWANRYLQMYPDQATGVVLDAFAVGLLLTRDDQYFNDLGQRWMDACALDAECGAKLGPDPWQVMTDAIAGLESGSCPEIAAQGWTRAELHVFWSFFFYTWEYRSLIAPMVYRLDRCAPADVAAFQILHDVFTQPQEPTAAQRYFSMMLSTHVMLSELWEDPPPSADELIAYQASANVAHGIAARAQELYDAWPRYSKDEYAGLFAATEVPILMVRGAYDFIPLTSIQPAVDHFADQGARFVEVPNAPHSPYAAPSVSGSGSCGAAIRGQFWADPTATLDTSCLANVAPLPLVPSSGLSEAAFGFNDPWDGGIPNVAPQPWSPSERVDLSAAARAFQTFIHQRPALR